MEKEASTKYGMDFSEGVTLYFSPFPRSRHSLINIHERENYGNEILSWED